MEAETAEEARELLAAGAGYRFQIGECIKGTSNNTRFQRFLSWLSGRLQRSCRGECPIGVRFEVWPGSVLCRMPHGLHP